MVYEKQSTTQRLEKEYLVDIIRRYAASYEKKLHGHISIQDIQLDSTDEIRRLKKKQTKRPSRSIYCWYLSSVIANPI